MRVGVVLLAVVSVVLAWSGRAEACSCLLAVTASPGDGAKDVPLNAVVRIHGRALEGQESRLTLLGPDGGVPATTSQLNANTFELRPLARLEPLTRYTISSAWTIRSTGGAGDGTASFTTGATEDHVAPATPSISAVRELSTPWWEPATSCGRSQSFALTLAGLSDDVTPGAELSVNIDSDDSGRDHQQRWSITEAAASPWVTDNLCGRNFPTSDSPQISIRISAVDWAGNVSAPSPPRYLKGAGCAVVPAGGVLPALALAVFLRGRRRNR